MTAVAAMSSPDGPVRSKPPNLQCVNTSSRLTPRCFFASAMNFIKISFPVCFSVFIDLDFSGDSQCNGTAMGVPSN